MPAGFAAIVGTTAVADATALTGFAEAVAGGAELAGAAAGAGIAAADLGAGAADVGGGLGAAVTGDVGAGIAPDITGTFATEGGAAFTPTAADITGTVSGIAGGATPATAADLTGTFGQTFSQMGGFGPLTGGGADLTGTLGTAGQALGQGAGLSAPGVPTTTPALTGTAATAPAPSVAGAAPIAAPAPAPPPAPAGLDPNLVNPDVAARDFTVAGNYAPSAPPAGPPTPAENLDQLYGSPWTGAPTVPQAPNIYTPHNLLPDPWHLNPPGVQPGEFISSADPGADPFAGARGMVAGGNTQTDWEAIQAAQGNLTGGGVVSPGDAYPGANVTPPAPFSTGAPPQSLTTSLDTLGAQPGTALSNYGMPTDIRPFSGYIDPGTVAGAWQPTGVGGAPLSPQDVAAQWAGPPTGPMPAATQAEVNDALGGFGRTLGGFATPPGASVADVPPGAVGGGLTTAASPTEADWLASQTAPMDWGEPSVATAVPPGGMPGDASVTASGVWPSAPLDTGAVSPVTPPWDTGVAASPSQVNAELGQYGKLFADTASNITTPAATSGVTPPTVPADIGGRVTQDFAPPLSTDVGNLTSANPAGADVTPPTGIDLGGRSAGGMSVPAGSSGDTLPTYEAYNSQPDVMTGGGGAAGGGAAAGGGPAPTTPTAGVSSVAPYTNPMTDPAGPLAAANAMGPASALGQHATGFSGALPWLTAGAGPAVALAGLGLNAGKSMGLFGSTAYPGQTEIGQIAQQQQQSGAELQSYLASGTLPPGLQAAVNSAAADAEAGMRSMYATRMGGTSSAEETDIQNMKARMVAQSASIAKSLFDTGVNQTELATKLYTELMNQAIQQDQALSQSIGNFASALAMSATPLTNLARAA